MKKKVDFLIRKIAGESIMVPVGDTAATFSGLIKPNDTAAFIWENLEEAEDEEALAQMICDEFEVDYDDAFEDVKQIVANMRQAGWIE